MFSSYTIVVLVNKYWKNSDLFRNLELDMEAKNIDDAINLIGSKAPLVCIEGLKNINNLAFNNFLIKQKATSKGAVRMISEAMTRFLNNGTVQEDGCHALRCLLFRNVSARETIIEQGAINAVINSIQEHPHHIAVQEEGLWCLVVFFHLHEKVIDILVKNKSLIEKSVSLHLQVDAIQKKGSFLLHCITENRIDKQ